MSDLISISVETGTDEENYISSLHMVRGKIISHFSHVEFMYADFYFRALKLPEYSSLPVRFPYRIKDRVNAVKTLANMPGPINRYREEILEIVDGIFEFDELRHMMAHANMLTKYDGKKSHVDFLMYNQPDRDNIQLIVSRSTLKDLSNKAIDVGRYYYKVIRLYHRICTEIPLPLLDR